MSHASKEFTRKKTCKYCASEFVLTYYAKDQSTIAACNKMYCSNACKKKWQKFRGAKNSICLKCEKCESVYYKPPSLAQNSRFCSRACANRQYAANNRQERTMIKCAHCSAMFEAIHTSRRKYCSQKCASLGNRTIERVNYQCEMCGSKFEGLESDPRRFCTRNCQYEGQSAGLVKIPTNGRSGVRIDLPESMYFKSSLEADYARFCIHIGRDFSYECKTFSVELPTGKVRRYTPDFFHPDVDEFVELKARRSDRKYETNLEAVKIVEKMGYNIKVVFMRDFYEKLKKEGLYDKIDNLERRNYKGTKHLIVRDG